MSDDVDKGFDMISNGRSSVPEGEFLEATRAHRTRVSKEALHAKLCRECDRPKSEHTSRERRACRSKR